MASTAENLLKMQLKFEANIFPFFFGAIKQANNHVSKRFFLLRPLDTSFRAFRTKTTYMIGIICKIHFTFCYTLHSFPVVFYSFFFFFFIYLFV